MRLIAIAGTVGKQESRVIVLEDLGQVWLVQVTALPSIMPHPGRQCIFLSLEKTSVPALAIAVPRSYRYSPTCSVSFLESTDSRVSMAAKYRLQDGESLSIPSADL